MADNFMPAAPGSDTRQAQIIIIGAGFGGVALGSKLRRSGRGDFLIPGTRS